MCLSEDVVVQSWSVDQEGWLLIEGEEGKDLGQLEEKILRTYCLCWLGPGYFGRRGSLYDIKNVTFK